MSIISQPTATPDTATPDNPPFDPSSAAFAALSGGQSSGPNLPAQSAAQPSLAAKPSAAGDIDTSVGSKLHEIGKGVLDVILGPRTRPGTDIAGNPVNVPLSTGQRIGNVVSGALRGAAAGAGVAPGPGAVGRAFLAGVQMSDAQRKDAADAALRSQQMIRTALDLKAKGLEIGVQKATLLSSLQQAKDDGDVEVGRFKSNDDIGEFLNNQTPNQSKDHARIMAGGDPTKSYRTFYDPSGSGFIVMQHDKKDDELPIGEGDHPLYQFNVTTDPKTGKQVGALDIKGQAAADMPKGKYHDWNQEAQSKLGAFQLQQATLGEKLNAVAKTPPVDQNSLKTFVQTTLPTYTHIPSNRVQAYRQEAAGVKTQADLEKLQARVDSDERGGQVSESSRILANSNRISQRQQPGIANNEKFLTDPHAGYLGAAAQLDQTRKSIAAGADGNALLTNMVPTMEVLGINHAAGINRISPAEARAAGQSPEWSVRWNAFADAAMKGKLTPELAREGNQLVDIVQDTAYRKLTTQQQVNARSYGLNYADVPSVTRDGEVTTLDKVAGKLGKAPAGGIAVTDPTGGIHTFPDQASADKFKKLAGIR